MMPNLARTLVPSLVGVALLSLAAVTAWTQSTPSPALPQLEGQRVAVVRVVDESGDVLEQNATDLPLRPGQPYTADAERSSLRQLFLTGHYDDLAVEAAQDAAGLRIDFVVRLNFYVNAVAVVGLHEPPSDSVAVSALRLGLGEAFRGSDMPAALDRLQHTLEDEGLYQAKLAYRTSPHADTRQTDITVTVAPGTRARVGTLTLMNDTPFGESEVLDRLKLKSNTQITSAQLARSTDRTQKWLTGRGYLGARVSITRGAYDAGTNQVPLAVRVFAGLNVRVQVVGAKVSSGTLRGLLPIYEEGAVDDDLLQEGRRNLRDYIERQGYFDAEVTYTTSQAPPQGKAAGAEIITFQVQHGARRRLVGVVFAGNRYFNDEILRSRVGIQPAAFASRGRFSSQQLSDDVMSLTNLYQASGFAQADVKSEVVENYRGKSGDLFVRFNVTEGQQTRVAELTIEGNHALSTAELSRVISSTSGQPFSDFNVAGDRDIILALYYDQGFPQAQLRTTVENLTAAGTDSGSRVNLTYQIDEGAQVRVARVLVGGYEHTRPNVIVREVQLQAGQPLSEGAVVETQRRLYNLGIFSRASIAPQNPNGTDESKTVDVLVEEARRYTIAYGLGLEVQRLGSASNGPVAEPLRFSPRATFEFTKLNLTGRADSLSFKARASTLQGRALLTYTAPNYFGSPKLSLQLTALYDKTRDVLTFTSTRAEGSVQITDQVSTSTSFLFRYVYRHVQAGDLQVAPEEIPLFSQPTQVSFFSVTWLRDRRDSAADPTHGSFNTIDVDLAGRSIGSSASFLRATVQNTTYTRIGQRLIFARSTRVGIEQPLGATVANDIPLPERFFAGGGTTLRGFGLNQAGPRDLDTGFPVGGLGMIVFNQQLQFPMRLPFIGNRLSGAVFYDAGNVFSNFSAITLRVKPSSPVFDSAQPNLCLYNCTNDLNYFSHTVGIELRYQTPVGPVSIDFAYQLNPARFLIPANSAAPDGLTVLSRLPAFQFFVNLGATF